MAGALSYREEIVEDTLTGGTDADIAKTRNLEIHQPSEKQIRRILLGLTMAE